ncbi:MAG: DinB family protein [Chlorobi bacterium]|nr:DinB family protein [Chlorobiota bacterium]MCI0715617.1 DinB family protein [Chlorobiota bacterium]
MKFSIEKSVEILERTPRVLEELLNDLSDEWITSNEGADSWSPYDIMGHLIHGEKTDWITRMQIILSGREDKSFEPFDRFAQFKNSKGKSIKLLLDEFKQLRKKNIETLNSANITSDQLNLTGIHPEFGEVTLEQLIATWVVHDLSHIVQISRVMAMQYKDEVGPWIEYLPILTRK